MYRNIFFSVILVIVAGCHQRKLEGYWESVYFNENTFASSSDSPIINPYFQGTTKVMPSLFFAKKKIEFPFGFKGFRSLSFSDNFRNYKLKGKQLIIFEEAEKTIFDLEFLSSDSFCIEKDNVSIICYERKAPFLPCDLRELEFEVKDEHFKHTLSISENGELFLLREGVKQDTIIRSLVPDEFEYINELISRVRIGEKQIELSDAPDYYLKLRCGKKTESFTSTGLQHLPYNLKALMYNLEKLTKYHK